MIDKTLEQKIAEKKADIKTIDALIVINLDLYQTVTNTFKELYDVNKGKVQSHLAGISNIMDSITKSIKQKAEIQDEINRLESLDENGTVEDTPEEFTGNKDDFLNIVKEQEQSVN